MDSIGAKLTEPKIATAFASAFVDEYLKPAFGARSKTEIDLLVFSCLAQAGAIDPAAPLYELARALNVTPSRIRSLVMNWQLRSTSATENLEKELIAALQKTRFAKDGTLMSFGIESPLLREDIRARLKRRGVFADASFSAELIRLPVEAFVDFLDDLVDEKTKTGLVKMLAKDKQVADKSFKGVVTAVLLKLGEKVAGKVGEEFAKQAGEALVKPAVERLTGFLGGLLDGNPKGAVSALAANEIAV